MSRLSSPWETFRRPITPEDPHYFECTPDLHVADLLDLTPEMLCELGVQHLFVDFDGTMTANANIPPMADTVLAHMQTLAADPRFSSFNIATDNRSSELEGIAKSIGSNVRLFQPLETPKGPIMKFHDGFYRRLLFETDIWDTPELGVMIGDSLRYDIAQAKANGMKAVLVDRLEKRIARHLLQTLGKIDPV